MKYPSLLSQDEDATLSFITNKSTKANTNVNRSILEKKKPAHAGRPKCVEFEEEVLAECKRASSMNSFKRKRPSSPNDYSYVQVRKCAETVMNRDYWDDVSCSFVKKWQLNRTTNKLCFTNKWVYGVLRRHAAASDTGSSCSGVSSQELSSEVAVAVLDQREVETAAAMAASPYHDCRTSTQSTNSLSSSADWKADRYYHGACGPQFTISNGSGGEVCCFNALNISLTETVNWGLDDYECSFDDCFGFDFK